MDSLIKLATWAVIEYGRTSRATTITAALCAGLAIVLMLAALGCAVTALWLFTLPSLGSVGAPLVVAASLTVLALIFALAAWFYMRRNRRSPGATTPQLLMTEAMRLFSEHKGAVLLAAVVAGMAAANGGRKS
jgi:hypothetical protein